MSPGVGQQGRIDVTLPQLCIEFKGFKVEGMSEHADDIVNRLRRSFMANFPAMPEGAWFETDVEPIARLEPLPFGAYCDLTRVNCALTC